MIFQAIFAQDEHTNTYVTGGSFTQHDRKTVYYFACALGEQSDLYAQVKRKMALLSRRLDGGANGHGWEKLL